MNLREKQDWVNPGSHYPRSRIEQADALALEYGLTRNGLLNLAFRVAFPILKSNLRSLKASIRHASEAALLLDSQTVPPPGRSERRAKRKG